MFIVAWHQRKRKLEETTRQLEDMEKKRKATEANIQKAKVGREETVSL